MRRGEVLGLRWREADLSNKRLAIVRALVDVNREVLVSEPKTTKGRCTVAFDAVTAAELKRHRIRQPEDRLRVGEVWQDTGLVFTHEDGSHISPRLLSSWFSSFLEMLDSPGFASTTSVTPMRQRHSSLEYLRRS